MTLSTDLNQIWHEKGEEEDEQRIRNIISGAVRENKKYSGHQDHNTLFSGCTNPCYSIFMASFLVSLIHSY